MVRLTTLHLIDTPNGRWKFVGSVPAALSFMRKDGAEFTDEDARKCRDFGPGIVGCTSLSWATRKEAMKAAQAIGAVVEEQQTWCGTP